MRSGQCDDAIDARESVDEAAGALVDSGVGKPLFEHQNGTIAARVALHADASDGSQPALFEPLDRCSLLAAQAANGQSRPGEGMPSEQIGAQAELAAQFAHLVLVKQAQRFDEAVLGNQLLNAGHAVVMGLDQIGFRRSAGLDRVGVNRALAQDPVVVEIVARLQDRLLHSDECFAYDVTLLLRIGDSLQGSQEPLLGMLDGKDPLAQ